MAFQSQGSTLRGPVAVASGSALYKGLGNGPSSSSAPFHSSCVTGRRDHLPDSQGPRRAPDARLLNGHLSPADLHRQPQRRAQRLAQRAHALRQASPPAS